jgi:hypothetical protein
MRLILRLLLVFAFLVVLVPIIARADAALLLEEPFGGFGAMNPTGHAAIYLNRVCADSPMLLRACRDGEQGVVLSRYHRIDGYDWLAVPLIPYLYAVDDASDIPTIADTKLETRLRNDWRRNHLEEVVPDDPVHEFPTGEWIELVGASYDRRIWGFEVATTPEQDSQLIADFNNRRNVSHFDLFFRNCANFSEHVLNFYYPHSIHRNFIADTGMMTPKQTAKSLVKYSRRHPETEMRTFVIPQVPGTIKRSTPVDGVVESLVKSKKYVVPIAVFNPYIAGSLIAAYLVDGRFHPDPHAPVYNPSIAVEPGQPANALTESAGQAPAEALTDDKSVSADRQALPDHPAAPGAPDPKL